MVMSNTSSSSSLVVVAMEKPAGRARSIWKAVYAVSSLSSIESTFVSPGEKESDDRPIVPFAFIAMVHSTIAINDKNIFFMLRFYLIITFTPFAT